jgi:hypothetical protein
MGLCCCKAIPPSMSVPADEVIRIAVAQLRCVYLQARPYSASFRISVCIL